MRKYILCLIMLLISICNNAQTIISDKMVNDSIRTIETSNVMYRKFTDTVIWNYGIKCFYNTNSKETKFILIINLNANSDISYKEHGKLLIKLFNDSIIALDNVGTLYNNVILGYSYHKPIYGNIGIITKNVITRNISEFFITKRQLESLHSGIKKVRVETINGYQEKEYKNDKIGKKLYDSFTLLLNTIENNKPTNFYNNF